MVSAVIFSLHGIVAVWVFAKKRRSGGTGEGLLAVGLFGILFSVGWTILTMVTGLFFPPEGLASWLDRDALTLTLLTIVEGVVWMVIRPRGAKEGEGLPGKGSTGE